MLGVVQAATLQANILHSAPHYEAAAAVEAKIASADSTEFVQVRTFEHVHLRRLLGVREHNAR